MAYDAIEDTKRCDEAAILIADQLSDRLFNNYPFSCGRSRMIRDSRPQNLRSVPFLTLKIDGYSYLRSLYFAVGRVSALYKGERATTGR